MEKIESALKFAKSLEGVKYSLWTEDMEDCGCFCYTENGKPPSKEVIKKQGINCTGMINLMRRKLGLEIPGNMKGKPKQKYCGGTFSWFNYLKNNKRLLKINYEKVYPKGTLLISKYKNQDNQGHVAVVYESSPKGLLYSKCIHSCFIYPIKQEKDGKMNPGVILDKYVAQSAFWYPEGTYSHVCLPQNWLLKN